ncbi:hypothetical protein GDO86_015814 [Hymenochirus boettgeri]|uniref:Uncharacterized protein n=1 Tax=Hymenochirus boettgeri TaxID=247094 RepID=A0A8T2K2L2_9PIPI|nr:hypothetical protein GDO86_015814 [Hymenochirus boettgeri]
MGASRSVDYKMDLDPYPDDILIVILSFVPARDLVRNCRRVNRHWRHLVDSPTLWRNKCEREWSSEPFRGALGVPNMNWQRASVKSPFSRNLIKNPCGKEGLQHWRTVDRGDGWVVENNRTDLEGSECQKSFVTSFSWCEKTQIVSLLKEGLWEEILDSYQPHICISDWFAGRDDCGCVYKISVELLAADRERVIDEFHENPDPIPQWNDESYHQVSHVFQDYGPGVRYVKFNHKGRDTQFWKGWYGSRITNSSVTVRFHKN